MFLLLEKNNKMFYWADVVIIIWWDCWFLLSIILLVDMREIYLTWWWPDDGVSSFIWSTLFIQYVIVACIASLFSCPFHFPICFTTWSELQIHSPSSAIVRCQGHREGEKESNLFSKDIVLNECTDTESVTPYMRTTIHQHSTRSGEG